MLSETGLTNLFSAGSAIGSITEFTYTVADWLRISIGHGELKGPYYLLTRKDSNIFLQKGSFLHDFEGGP